MYEIKFTPNVSVAAGDYIQVHFTTNDLLQPQLFLNDLGKTLYANYSYELSCHESDQRNRISPIPLSCKLFSGDATASPPVPAVVQIPVKNTINSNTEIKFTILNIRNPTLANYPIGIKVRLMNTCENGDLNNLCAYYSSTHYIKFDPTPVIPSTQSNIGTMNENPGYVSATNVQHTFTGPYTVNTGDYVKIVYIPQTVVPNICSITSANGICYSYPL